MRPLTRTIIGCLCAAIVLLTDVVPHRHSDSTIELSFLEAIAGGEAHIVQCSTGNSGATHFDPERTLRADPCLACLRDHMQGTTRHVDLRTPDRVVQFLPP